jgi:CDGSH-type Zn-finger protein
MNDRQVTAAAVVLLLTRAMSMHAPSSSSTAVVSSSFYCRRVQVVDMLKVEDLPKKAVFCRCWKSKKFPYCDGAHAKHNQVSCKTQTQETTPAACEVTAVCSTPPCA